GGFSPDRQRWITCRPGFFLSVRVLSLLFRRLFLERLTAAYQAGRLHFFTDQAALAEPAAFQARLATLRKRKWVVYAKRPFGGPDAVLAYLSRYTHRIAIANSRLALQQGRVGRGAGGRWPLQPGIVARLGHAEHACHRGNREAGLVRAHEPEEPDGSVPVSRANQAAAFERISRSSRSCLFSRRSRVNSSRSNALRPGAASSRRPSFRSAWATHARMEWPLGSNSRARSSGLRPARTRSTICRRNSGEYGGRVLGIGSTSGERLRVSTKPGQSQVNAEQA